MPRFSSEEEKQAYYDKMFASGSYESPSIRLNVFDWAYRSETKEQYYIDLATFAGSVLPGTGGRLVRVLAKGLDVILEGDPEQN